MDPMQFAVVTLFLVAFVAYRQMMTRPTARRGVLILGFGLMVIGFANGGVVDTRHPVLSVAVVAVELACAVAFGALRASTMRVWRDEAGVTWSRGTGWTLLAWFVSIVSRLLLFAAGSALGLVSRPTAVLVFAGLTIAVQSVLVARRGLAMSGTSVRERGSSSVAS